MSNKIIIPVSFKLNGKTIEVLFDDLYCSENGCFGEADYTDKKITLCKKYKGKRLKKKEIEETFYHELAHMLLDAAGSHNLKYNEDFVDRLGMMLCQFEKTRK